jgi:hypothetical protein
LDAKYEKADLNAVALENCKHLSVKRSCWSSSQSLRIFLMEH